jgi:hypothetical protein
MRRYHFILLTLLIVSSIMAVLFMVRLPLPSIPEYTFFTIESKGYKVFDLRLHLKKYNHLKKVIAKKQTHLSKKYALAKDTNTKIQLIEQTKQYLAQAIAEDILPYWFDTQWDFNGTTENPREGTIACGFFISTVLQHAGMNTDRLALGRETAGAVIQTLCKRESIHIVRKNNFQKLYEHLRKQKDGIYILGMDWHIGFIIKKNNKMRFIHSRKPRHAGVLNEDAEDSPTLKLSNFYMVGNLLENDRLIVQWLNKNS